MAIDLPTLYAQILTCQTLAAGRDVLFAALTGAVPELAALTPHPDDPSRQIAWSALLGEALTRNTSHVSVLPNDPLIDVVRSAIEMPARDKAARVASIKLAVEQKSVAEVEVSLGSVIDDLAAKIEEIDQKRVLLATESVILDAQVAAVPEA